MPGAPASPDKVWEIAPKQINEDDDFLCLFFPETPAARAAGLASLRRLDRRLLDSAAVVSAEGWPRQLDAISHWANGEGAAWERLEELTIACARG